MPTRLRTSDFRRDPHRFDLVPVAGRRACGIFGRCDPSALTTFRYHPLRAGLSMRRDCKPAGAGNHGAETDFWDMSQHWPLPSNPQNQKLFALVPSNQIYNTNFEEQDDL
ncbi:hypothetical protein [Allosphingosinicella indica]|uniref:hypothetical protein n=1 Tax=Allosphingosinicella indica TaxID=941907 RepID=UPI0012F48D89|nr:hypothetical protein [Allosphingosinicella indica]